MAVVQILDRFRCHGTGSLARQGWVYECVQGREEPLHSLGSRCRSKVKGGGWPRRAGVVHPQEGRRWEMLMGTTVGPRNERRSNGSAALVGREDRTRNVTLQVRNHQFLGHQVLLPVLLLLGYLLVLGYLETALYLLVYLLD